jgi:raffinose/stachyose/melibiose transport system permease protein
MKKYTRSTFIGEISMLLVCALFVIPLYYLVVSTFKTQAEIIQSPLALPSSLNLENYTRAFAGINFVQSFLNSLLITSVSVVLIVLFGSMAGYAIARWNNRLTRFLRVYFLAGFLVPLQVTMLPLFIIMKNLQLINTYQGMILLHSNGAVFAIFLYTAFIRAMPRDLEEAAFVDGAGLFRTFWQIVFPLLRPVTATLIIFNTMWIWNDFLLSYLFLSSTQKATLTLQVYNGVGQYFTDWSIMMPVLVIALLPMVIFYLFMQRHIIGGLTTGSLKG